MSGRDGNCAFRFAIACGDYDNRIRIRTATQNHVSGTAQGRENVKEAVRTSKVASFTTTS